MNNTPDIEVVFKFNGTRKNRVYDGYRPAHLIDGEHLTTGTHKYYNCDSVAPNGTAAGTITFISPEDYPECLWVGKRINIQEGVNVVGYATIKVVHNKILEKVLK